MAYVADEFVDFFVTTVYGGAGGIGSSLGAADTSLLVPPGIGALLPSSWAGNVKILLGTLTGAHEIAFATSRSTDTLTISRGQESTSAATWAFGTACSATATSASLDKISNALVIAMGTIDNSGNVSPPSTTAGTLHITFPGAASDPANAGTTPAIHRSTGNTLDIIGGTSGMRLINNNAAGYTRKWQVDNSGNVTNVGHVIDTITNGATLSTGNTINTQGIPAVRYTTAGAVTGIILQVGATDGEKIFIINDSANTITMATAATSNVADGASCIIAANRSMEFIWYASTARWFHTG